MEDPIAFILAWDAQHTLCTKCQKNPPVPTNSWCRPCLTANAKDWRRRNPGPARDRVYNQSLRDRFGITIHDYHAMCAAQNDSCALCGLQVSPPGPNERRGLHVDHDHRTGQIRGLLCPRCNLLLRDFEGTHDKLLTFAARLLDYLIGPPPVTQTKFPIG